jgi:hypothetical protein
VGRRPNLHWQNTEPFCPKAVTVYGILARPSGGSRPLRHLQTARYTKRIREGPAEAVRCGSHGAPARPPRWRRPSNKPTGPGFGSDLPDPTLLRTFTADVGGRSKMARAEGSDLGAREDRKAPCVRPHQPAFWQRQGRQHASASFAAAARGWTWQEGAGFFCIQERPGAWGSPNRAPYAGDRAPAVLRLCPKGWQRLLPHSARRRPSVGSSISSSVSLYIAFVVASLLRLTGAPPLRLLRRPARQFVGAG